MAQSRADLFLNPIRLRIIAELTGGNLTTGELAQALPDVPQATLYRHVKTLADGGVIRVVEENPVRGTVERVYALHNASLAPDDLRQMSKDELLEAATLIVSGLLGDFQSYLATAGEGDLDVAADGLDYSKGQLYLTDEEFRALNRELWRVLQSAMHNRATPERTRRIFAYLFIPTGR